MPTNYFLVCNLTKYLDLSISDQLITLTVLLIIQDIFQQCTSRMIGQTRWFFYREMQVKNKTKTTLIDSCH